jgi:hypothetical protein
MRLDLFSRPRPPTAGRSARIRFWLCLGALALAGCGSTLEDQPLAPSSLESLIATREYPVYWLGKSFSGLSVSEASRDRSGAYTVQYGNCIKGGQYACESPLSIVTSPENDFVAAGSAGVRVRPIRGVSSFTSEAGRAVEIPTGSVVVSIRADNAGLARAAALAIVPINGVGLPAAPLPKVLPATSFATQPLPTQLKSSASKSQ